MPRITLILIDISWYCVRTTPARGCGTAGVAQTYCESVQYQIQNQSISSAVCSNIYTYSTDILWVSMTLHLWISLENDQHAQYMHIASTTVTVSFCSPGNQIVTTLKKTCTRLHRPWRSRSRSWSQPCTGTSITIHPPLLLARTLLCTTCA